MKTVVITGVSRGIGKATAEHFLAEGWQVIGTSTTGTVPIINSNLTIIKLDLVSKESIEKAVEGIKQLAPTIDVLINNAAVQLDDWYDRNLDLVKLETTIQVNLLGVIKWTEELLSLMRKDGRIINFGSQSALFNEPVDDESDCAAYRISKAAINMYTRTLAARLKGQRNIAVASIDPGWVKTDMGSKGGEEPDREVSEAANDVFNLATRVDLPSGKFWYLGKERSW